MTSERQALRESTPVVTRRRVVQAGGLALAAGHPALANVRATATPDDPDARPATGDDVPELAVFDTVMHDVLSEFSIPGGQCAIAHEGRLVFNRGYGYGDVEAGTPVDPAARFRIASTSKPITAVAALKLIDDGLLRLDQPVFPLLALEPAANATVDPRLDEITVEQLLVHSGGWDSEARFDPQYLPWSRMAAATVGAPDPPDGETIIRYMLGVPLDFDPGTQSAYSNFGYNVLGRLIEHLSGQSYADYCQEQLFAPAGITSMLLGGTRLEERLDGEVRYYGPPGQEWLESVYPGEGYVPVGYGSFYMPALDAHGGWISTAADLIRFALAVDGARGESLLSPESVQAMEETPRPPSSSAGAGNEPGGYGLGWGVTPTGDGAEWAHAGALEGSNASWLLRLPGGGALAVVFNSLPEDYGGFFGTLIPRLRESLATISAWPAHDLFD